MFFRPIFDRRGCNRRCFDRKTKCRPLLKKSPSSWPDSTPLEVRWPNSVGHNALSSSIGHYYSVDLHYFSWNRKVVAHGFLGRCFGIRGHEFHWARCFGVYVCLSEQRRRVRGDSGSRAERRALPTSYTREVAAVKAMLPVSAAVPITLWKTPLKRSLSRLWSCKSVRYRLTEPIPILWKIGNWLPNRSIVRLELPKKSHFFLFLFIFSKWEFKHVIM